MKIRSVFLLLGLLAIFIAKPFQTARAQEVDYAYFYDNLAPYGEWMDVERYGYCFHPTDLPPDWRPYTDGYWAYTDAGWTWVSNEPFGTIAYHYGRWFHLADVGWLWRPGTTWAPAWVSWRRSDEYVGWAPLPPEAAFRANAGIGIGVDVQFDIGPSFYAFCPFRHFGAPLMRDVILPREQNVTVIQNTTNITNITTIRNNNSTVIYNGGPSYQTVSARSEQPIRTMRLQRQPITAGVKPASTHQVGNMLVMSAPVVRKPAQPMAPKSVARKLSGVNVDKGWGTVKDPAVRQQLQQHYASQTKGLTPAQLTAKPVDTQAAHAALPPASAKPGHDATAGTPESRPSGMTPERARVATPEEPTARHTPKPKTATPEHSHATPGDEPTPHHTPKPKSATSEHSHGTPGDEPTPHHTPKPKSATSEHSHGTPGDAPTPHRTPKSVTSEHSRATPGDAPTPHRVQKPSGQQAERPHTASPEAHHAAPAAQPSHSSPSGDPRKKKDPNSPY